MSHRPVKLGLMPPLTGVVGLYGEEISRAATIACAEVNASGGVLGRPLELVIEDDGSLPETAVAAAEKLVGQHHCVAFIGNLLSNSRIAVAYRVAEPRRVPYLNFSFYEGSILSRYFFHFAALPNQQIDRMIPYMRRNFGPRMFFAGNNYEWPRGSIHAAKLALERAGGEVVGEEYCPIGVDAEILERLLDHVEAATPDVFVPYFAGADQTLLLTRFTRRGLKQRMAVVMGHYDEMMASTLPAAVREGFYSSNTYFMAVDSPENRAYLERLAQLPGVNGIWPNGNGILTNFGEGAYICVKAFAQAANRAESLDPEALVEELRTVEMVALQGRVQMDPNHHHARVNTYLARCEADGTFAIVEKFGAIEPELPERYRHQQVSQRATLEEDTRLQARMLEQMSEAILLIDSRDGHILYTNAGAERLFGYGKGEMIGRRYAGIDDPSVNAPTETFAEISHILRLKGEWQGEVRNIRNDGSRLWCQATVSAFTHPVYGEVWMAVHRDISERKRVEEELRKSQTRYKALADTSPLAIVLSEGIDQKTVYANPTFERLFGYAMEEHPTVKEWWPLAYPDEDYRQQLEAEWQQRVARAIETHSGIEPMEAVVTCKDGSQKHIRWGFINLGEENWAFGLDLTELKRAESALQDSVSTLQAVLQSTSDGILAVNSQDEVLFANDRFAEMWRIPHEILDSRNDAVLRRHVLDQLADPQGFLRLIQELYGTERASVDTLLFQDGRVFERSSRPWSSEGKIQGRAWFFRDVTERRQAERDKQASEEKFRAFYELGLVGLAVTSPEKSWIRVNDCLCQMLEYPEAELREMTWAELTHPDDLAADVERFNRLLAHEIDGYSLEKRFISRSGKIIYAQLVVRCVRKASGEVDYVVVMVEDITERKHMESELRDSLDLARRSRLAMIGILEDQRQAEAALRRSEERFKALADTSPLAIYATTGVEQKASYLNPTFTRLFGYTLEEVPSVGEWWPLAYPDENYRKPISEEWNRRVVRAIETQSEIEPMEVVVTCKDGSTKNILWGYRALGDENWAFGFDVTERKKAEAELELHRHHLEELVEVRTRELEQAKSAIELENRKLKQAEEKLAAFSRDFEAFLDQTTDFIYFKDIHSRFRFCSQTLAAVTGHKHWRDMIGKHDREVFPPDTAQIYEEEEAPIFAEGKPLLNRVDPYYDSAGRPGYVQTNKWPLFDAHDKVAGIFGISRDITDRIRAEITLREKSAALEQANSELAGSEQKFRGIAESGPFGIIVSDQAQKTVYLSPVFEQMFGYTVADIRSVEDWWPLAYPDEQYRAEVQQQWNSRIEEAIRNQSQIVPTEALVTCKDGRRKTIEFRAASTGEYNVVIFIDVTERVDASRALEQAKQAAEHANLAKSTFLAHMSHELRTPMNVITGMCYLAQRTQLDARQRRYLQNIEVAARTLLGLINDVLDLSKIESGRLEIAATPFAIEEVVDSMVRIQSSRAEEKGLEFNVLIQQDVPRYLMGDALRLGQICSNLVSNAIKFTEQGEVILRVSQTGQQGDEVGLRFEVSDTGIGMAPEFMGRLFQPFEQEDGSTTRRFGGTGLGLNICKRLADAMGGEIGAQSEAGKGSTFWFQLTLPVAPSVQLSRPLALPEKLKVLVVDDSPSTQEVLQGMLESMHYRVDIVGSGEAAIAALRAAASAGDAQAYDLLLMDWRMPGLDGIETTRRIRSGDSLAKVPIIIMVTAYGSEEVRESAQRAGMDGFLAKPVTNSTLYDAIQTAFNRHPERLKKLPAPSVDPSLAGLRVLMAEDSAINREILGAMLAAANVAYTEADNGETALQRLQELQYDLVLMDVEMPRMGGLEAARRLRAQERFTDLPIIVMTAHDVLEGRANYLEAGVSDSLSKPIEPEALYAMLKKWDRRAPAPPTVPNFSGARALVVEDAPANRDLLRELLADAGIAVAEAEDGRDGVERVTREAFDVVLMDIQMPVMDGLDATRKIRADARFGDLPIIAVTAHALSTDREKCLAAGMNDYLAKPIDPRQLYRLLGQYLSPQSSAPVVQREPVEPAAAGDVPLPDNSAHLAVDWGLAHVMGNRRLLHKLLLRFLQEHTQDHERMAEALREHDLTALSQRAHTLAGVAGGIGAAALLEQAKRLESLAGRGDATACRPLLAQVIEEHQAVIGILSQFKATLAPEPAATPHPALAPDAAALLLSALGCRLDHGDSRAQKYLALLEGGALGPDTDGHLREVQRCIKVFDFDGALSRLRALASRRGIRLTGRVAEAGLRQAEDCLAAGDIDEGVRILNDNINRPEANDGPP